MAVRVFVLLIFSFGLLSFSLEISAEDPIRCKFLTYNVLADPVEVEARIPALFTLLDKSNADVIALQEVDAWFIELLLKQDWAKKYHFSKQNETVFAPRGLLFLSKQPITKVSFGFLPSRQKRGYLLIETKIQDVLFQVVTCHLDSFLEHGEKRAEQLKEIFEILKPFEDKVLLGDFNFGDGEEPESKTIPADFQDVWLMTKGEEPGFTWNIEISQMAKEGSFPNETSRRIDRILIKSLKLKPFHAVIVGNTPVDKNKEVFPSDHFGLLGEFTFKK